MGMTAFYGNFDRDEQEAESLRTIDKAIEMGINFLDTAWIYQVCRNQFHSTIIIINIVNSLSARMENRTQPMRNWLRKQLLLMAE
jgi:aryl-alcohol dehydrogenase-like predicted oxidoreductase